ncbi:MAG: hypothetical protein ACR2JY_07170 [Chloroflexota bacterium]
MATLAQKSAVHASELSKEEARAIFERAARRHLQMSGDEFRKKWQAKAFGDDPDQPGVMDVAMLLALAH